MNKMVDRIKNFTSTLAQHAMNGNKYVEDHIYQHRLDICNGCEDREGEYCKWCGCHLPSKCWWEVAKCDKDKW